MESQSKYDDAHRCWANIWDKRYAVDYSPHNIIIQVLTIRKNKKDMHWIQLWIQPSLRHHSSTYLLTILENFPPVYTTRLGTERYSIPLENWIRQCKQNTDYYRWSECISLLSGHQALLLFIILKMCRRTHEDWTTMVMKPWSFSTTSMYLSSIILYPLFW